MPLTNRRTAIKSVAVSALAAGLPETLAASPSEKARGDASLQPHSPAELRAALQNCLGGMWPEPCDLQARVERVEHKDGYRLEYVRYQVEPGDTVAAYVLVPDNAKPGMPAPAVAVWHQHAGQYDIGKVEPAGLGGNPMHHTGVALARLGYVVICPDALCFGERRDPTGALKPHNFERFEFLRYVVAGKSLAWKSILDMRRAIDYLVGRPEVNAARIGCYGHSMGSTHTWLVAPFDERIVCAVGNCCLPTYAAIHRTHLLHCFPNFVPGWEQFGDTPDIVGLIAPRPLHLNFGETDDGSPIEEVRQAMGTIAAAYAKANAAAAFSHFIEPGVGHVLSDTMWAKASAWFERHLKPLAAAGLCLALCACFSGTAAAEQNVPPPGFTAIFNGQDMSGWYGWGTQDPTDLLAMTPAQRADWKRQSIEGGLLNANGIDVGDHLKAHWKVQDGELVNDGKGLYLTTDKDYGDFELWVDYKMLPLGDSGIYLRGVPQVQIWDFTQKEKFDRGADKGSGGLWNNVGNVGKFPLKRMDKPFGEWNTFNIRMIGERATVKLNGETVVNNARLENYFANKKAGLLKPAAQSGEATASQKVPNGFMVDPVFQTGPIQLQTHGSAIHWRNVFVREIPSEEANEELASAAPDGFVEYVNGKDLSKWQGAVDSYEVKDGCIACKSGKGGDLLTQDAFENGIIRIEFKLPRGGNNGIALRTPLGGHSARDGLELQVIDSDGYNAQKAAAGKPLLEPHQYHGSLYSCVGAKHGYLRAVGQWNFQEIEVRGQKITVTLNGTKILDVEIDQFDRSQIAHPPQGLDRTTGFIGLAGHSDPVQFRSFKVKKL